MSVSPILSSHLSLSKTLCLPPLAITGAFKACSELNISCGNILRSRENKNLFYRALEFPYLILQTTVFLTT